MSSMQSSGFNLLALYWNVKSNIHGSYTQDQHSHTRQE